MNSNMNSNNNYKYKEYLKSLNYDYYNEENDTRNNFSSGNRIDSSNNFMRSSNSYNFMSSGTGNNTNNNLTYSTSKAKNLQSLGSLSLSESGGR